MLADYFLCLREISLHIFHHKQVLHEFKKVEKENQVVKIYTEMEFFKWDVIEDRSESKRILKDNIFI